MATAPITLAIVGVHVHCHACGSAATLPGLGHMQGWAVSHRIPHLLNVAYRMNGIIYLSRPTHG